MELSKKVAYLKGLMAGLKIDGSSPEGQVLLYMSELLEQMADEIEDNTNAVSAITDYIDELEDGGDPFDDIDTYEYGFDPEGEEQDGSEGYEYDSYMDPDGEEPDEEDADDLPGSEEEPEEAHDDADAADAPDAPDAPEDDGARRFAELLGQITSDPDYTDDTVGDRSKLVSALESIVSGEMAKAKAKSKANAEPKTAPEGEKPEDDAAEGEEDLLERLKGLMQANGEGESLDGEADDGEGEGEEEMIFAMECPFCHSDITFAEGDLVNNELECPVCGNSLTIMM